MYPMVYHMCTLRPWSGLNLIGKYLSSLNDVGLIKSIPTINKPNSYLCANIMLIFEFVHAIKAAVTQLKLAQPDFVVLRS